MVGEITLLISSNAEPSYNFKVNYFLYNRNFIKLALLMEELFSYGFLARLQFELVDGILKMDFNQSKISIFQK